MKILNEEKHLPFALTNEENVSTKDREIKEMIQEVCPSYPLACKYCMVDEDCGTIEMVAHLYNAGYRKQSEGEDRAGLVSGEKRPPPSPAMQQPLRAYACPSSVLSGQS